MELLAIGIIGIFAAIAILYQGKLIGELRKDLSYKGNKLADSLSEWKDKFNTEKDKLEKLLNELGYGYADRKAPAGILCWGGGTVKEIQPKDYCVITDLGKRIKDQSNGMKYLAEIINKFEVELNTLKDHTHTVTVKKYSSNRALMTFTSGYFVSKEDIKEVIPQIIERSDETTERLQLIEKYLKIQRVPEGKTPAHYRPIKEAKK